MLHTQYVTPNMLRITLGGAALADFPTEQASAYVKLVFPQTNSSRPLLRTYTIRHQTAHSIDIDFALHDAKGPASSWAMNAQVGDCILVGGPGPKRLVTQPADNFIIAGDMTALPAISVNLAMLPLNATGFAIIEVTTRADIQTLEHPANMKLIWVIANEEAAQNRDNPLLAHIKALPQFSGLTSIWVACEFNGMKLIRKYLKERYDLPKAYFYTSSYWQKGHSEDEHKVAKSNDTE
ncbi:MAG: siderophore-interacting protein [Paraglaciecola sp.]|uniref:siderophore-interacting protein n=1 Tax=Gammaproteobacteria TaxID=1236 RepID=UPI001F3DC62C|nr:MULTISPECIES: siderophore-interacting protein [Gammaproteobacteria]MCF4010015.1 siderophore-interacting protein [Rheinheimera sp. UJ63]MDP5033037.1 siderophore-interacting protein [Paraglaciecola sp.]MDP5133722.1 siderophore-interacting protein [Paraglaciecola sp.]